MMAGRTPVSREPQATLRPTRRDVLKLGMVAAAGMVGLTGLTACGAVPEKPDQSRPQLRGGSYSHGATGGGLKDTLEPYFPVTNPDIARCLQLYEPLLRWNAQYEIEPSVAEAATPNGTTRSGRSGCATGWSSTTARR